MDEGKEEDVEAAKWEAKKTQKNGEKKQKK